MAQWNEIPAPTGKEALSRTYPAGYRTDVIDVPIQGNNGQLECVSDFIKNPLGV